MPRETRIAMSILLCVQLLAPVGPAAASDGARHCKKDCAEADYKKTTGPVTLEIGQPSVWSLAQAHYLLTKMHRTNRSLDTRMPTIDQLDASRANASKLEILRTLLQVDAGFDQSVGLKNQVELQHFREKEERKVQAQIQLQQRQAALQQLDQELLDLNQQSAVLTVQDGLADKARGSAPPSDADRQRKEQIASLAVQINAKQAQRTALQTEITSLTTTATGDVATPNVSVGSPPTSTPALGSSFTSPATAGGADSTALKDFASQAVKSFASSPSLAASAALDNFVGMQYEIIAKQLTLLRDEAGPDEWVVFFELPTSIYTVDRWANDLIAQVEWKVTKIYDQKPKADIVCRSLEGQDSPIALFKQLRFLPGAKSSSCLGELKQKAIKAALQEEGWSASEIEARARNVTDDDLDSGIFKTLGFDKSGSGSTYSITLDMIRKAYDTEHEDQSTELDPSQARALEIIPRQSALNVNEYQATTNNTGFLGLLKLLSGFGAQINFQRQKELYQDFLQQDVYASGFGKGTASFGWTFGPLPGSRRLAPGQRTTYAVLTVPRKALAVRITADAWAFPNKVEPEKRDLVRHRSFLVRIPSEETERFWVKSAVYAPVQKGKATTVLVQGNGLSPQLGVLVNGVSLKRALSISRAESDEPEITFPDSSVQGEFELTNSSNLVLRFSMGKDFVGTPIITLVTPERTSAINSFPMEVNSSHQSLADASLREPMFSDDFKIEDKLEKASAQSIGSGTTYYDQIQEALDDKDCQADKKYAFYRLNGTGLRPGAEIAINDTTLRFIPLSELSGEIYRSLCDGEPVHQPLMTQETTHSYLLYFEVPKLLRWPVRYRQPTRQSFDEFRFEHVLSPAGFKSELRNYQFNQSAGVREVDLTLSFPENLDDTRTPRVCVNLPRKTPQRCQDVRKDQDGKFRVHCDVSADQDERDFVSFEVQAELKPEEEPVKQAPKDGQKPQAVAAKQAPDPPAKKAESETKTWLFDLNLPVKPLLKEPPVTVKAQQQAVLRGINLQKVLVVLFGNQTATIDSAASNLPVQLTVKIPPKDVPAGQKEQVPIIFQTDQGPIPTGFTFEYAGPPLPKQVKPAKEWEH
ncbi:MAG: hypothetical protein JF614_03495 [Acidobacteria bacterium]|nr:hypothetical protein [Acidobacteriota bacterium]